MTSALRKDDMKALGLQLALELIHSKKEKDLITGLKTRTNPGRPDWGKVREQFKPGKPNLKRHFSQTKNSSETNVIDSSYIIFKFICHFAPA